MVDVVLRYIIISSIIQTLGIAITVTAVALIVRFALYVVTKERKWSLWLHFFYFLPNFYYLFFSRIPVIV
jgi:hypothetical protein